MTRLHRFTGVLLTALALAAAPLSMGCYCVDGYQSYATDLASATIDAGTPALVPLTISVPATSSTAAVGVELHVDDCRAGNLTVDARILRADGTTPATQSASVFPGTAPTAPRTISCPGVPARFAIASTEMTCASGRCTADLRVELTSTTGVGPREVELRLVKYDADSCRGTETLRDDGRIDVFGN